MPLRDFSDIDRQEGRMRVVLLLLALTMAACGFRQPDRGSSVTITLPPPKPATAPGFSSAISEGVR
jgi:hypothetical protein